MSTRVILICILLGTLALSSCRKRKWKRPTEVNTRMDINRSFSTGGNLVFNSGYIRLASYAVSGIREQGDPIRFEREWAGGTVVNFHQTSFSEVLDYDIPQGNYTELEIEFETYSGGNIAILVEGNYTNLSGTDIPVRFEFKDSETFEIFTDDDGGAPSMVLDKDVSSILTIQLDPIHWFQPVSTSLMENATLTNVSGTPTILITASINEDIYDIVVDRLDQSTEATI